MARLLLAFWGGWVMLCPFSASAWGFFAHERINGLAVNLLPPGLQALFRSQQMYLIRHATDPDKRRYAVKEEGPRHYIDLDHYGAYPFDSLPRDWKQAVSRFTEDTLQQHGIVPWWMEVMTGRLIKAFREKDIPRILQHAAEIGHYLSDAHVPLHTCRNHNGQFSGQRGIHGLWESRIPELLADVKWNFWIGQAAFIEDMPTYWWLRLLESSLAADSVLRIEKELDARTEPAEKYAYEERKGKLVRQYSTRYTKRYDSLLNGMVERRMRLSVQSVASIWFTCWVLAGQPDLPSSPQQRQDPEQQEMIRQLDRLWRLKRVNGSEHL